METKSTTRGKLKKHLISIGVKKDNVEQIANALQAQAEALQEYSNSLNKTPKELLDTVIKSFSIIQ